jgi:hypothetical protein
MVDKKRFALFVVKKDKRTWTGHETLEEAQAEADIYVSNGYCVMGISPYIEHQMFEDFVLEGHDSDEARQWGEVFPLHEFAELPVQDHAVVGSLAGYEVTLSNLKQLRAWIDKAVEHLAGKAGA